MATMNLADPELEFIDPTPDIHSMFVHFDKVFFWTTLVSRAVVRWSKRMYSCAGVCSYELRGGLCDIALSEPLLKLRPRKDLVETLLHEMIHAFLFVTNRDQDRDGHGPNFKAHMHRINKSAGLNISIYHSFHEEVELYQTHWWRCDGKCQRLRPHFGIVRRSANRAPGPSDYWWNSHKRSCGGTFIKIKEPENYGKKKTDENKSKENVKGKPNADITKYIKTDNIKTINSITDKNSKFKPPLKDNNINTFGTKTKSNNSGTLVVSKKGVVYNPTAPKASSPKSASIPVFAGVGKTIASGKHLTDSSNVTEHVRNIWANKEIPSVINKGPSKKLNNVNKEPVKTSTKHKAETSNTTPPAKIKKIDDYFKANATTVLKDLYGDDIKLTQNTNKTRLVAVSTKKELDLVDCPICGIKIDNKEINKHLDECLNKDIIEKINHDTEIVPNNASGQNSVCNSSSKETKYDKNTTTFKDKIENNKRKSSSKNLSDNDFGSTKEDKKPSNQKPMLKNIRKSDNFVTKDRGDSIDIKIEKDTIKAEPSTSKVDDSNEQKCPCCGEVFDKPAEEHLDECLAFFDNNTTIPEEGASTSFNNNTTIVIEDDDAFDDSQEFNATGTKCPCPCCMKMVEQNDMNLHLDLCLGIVVL